MSRMTLFGPGLARLVKPKRSNEEVAADWFRVIARHILATLDRLSDGNSLSIDDKHQAESHLVYCIHYLGKQCDPIEPDPREGPFLRCPCWFEGWQGEGDPPYHHKNSGWQSDVICDELLDQLQDESDKPFKITFDGSPCRLRVRDPQGWESWGVIEIDSSRGSWFLPEHGGPKLRRTLERALSAVEANRVHRAMDLAGGLTSVNYGALAADLEQLHTALFKVILQVGDSTDACGAAIDRLWLRLNDGDIERIDAPKQVREWLAQVWSDVEWAQRWFEMTGADPDSLSDVVSDRHATFVRRPTELRFDEHRQRSLILAGETDDRGDSNGSAGGKKRWTSSCVPGYPDGLEILQVIQLKFYEDKSLIGLSQREWADLLGCAKSGVQEALSKWDDYQAMPRRAARKKTADQDDFAYKGGRKDLLSGPGPTGLQEN